MIRIAIMILLASAYFSPAHAVGIDILNSPDAGIRHPVAADRAGADMAALDIGAVLERADDPPVPVPLPSSIWLFIAALAAGLMLIRRRVDTT